MERRIGRLRHLVSITAAVGVGSLVAACSQGDPPVVPSGPDPVVKATHAPPPISGGTLMISHSNPNLAVVSDTDRDKVWTVDLVNGVPLGEVDLNQHDEPGRLVEDSHGQVHVALRRGGDLATIDLATMHLERRHVCAAPRGVAYDKTNDVVHVACMNGELVTLPAKGGAATRVLHLDRDIQDVVVRGQDLVVSKFRSAELLVIGADGTIKSRTRPPAANSSRMRQMGVHETFSPDQAWRTINMPDGRIAMVHQRALDSEVVIRESGGDSYGGGGTAPGCDPTIVHTAISIFDSSHLATEPGPKDPSSPAIPNTLLPVDIAAHTSSEGVVEFSIVAAADNRVVTITSHALEAATGPDTNCDEGDDGQPVNGEPVALAYWGDKIVVQTRDPIAVTVLGTTRPQIVLPGADTKDTGHDMFHRNDGGTVRLACASCHGQGRDDGHVWNFNTGPRRTQNIANDVLTTAPFHWDGKMKDMGMIMVEVFEKRMGGRPQGQAHIDAFQTWLSKNPAMPNPVVGDESQIAAGKELFQGKAGCNGCHTGEKFTNNENENVGTQDKSFKQDTFQVPSLIGVAMRAPYMHDGCATTLKDRFDPTLMSKDGSHVCGGELTDQPGVKAHGNTAELTDAEVDELVAYLESL